MKIAINRCYGGFSLSDKAIEMIMKRKGLECHRYICTKYYSRDGVNEYIKVIPNNSKCDSTHIYYLTKDLGKTIDKLPKKYYWYYDSKLERTDEDLIAVIEELGADVNGSFGNIRIVEIPDDVDWEIDDYDGMETIEEVHRSWC